MVERKYRKVIESYTSRKKSYLLYRKIELTKSEINKKKRLRYMGYGNIGKSQHYYNVIGEDKL